MITNWHGILWASLSLGRTNTLIRVNTSYNARLLHNTHTHSRALLRTQTHPYTMYISITRAFISRRINARIYGCALPGLINFARPRVTNFARFLWFERHLRRLCGGFELMNATAAQPAVTISRYVCPMFFADAGKARSFYFCANVKRRVRELSIFA